MCYMKASHHVLLSLAGTSVTSCSDIQPPMGECNHEEADTRIVVHIQHALQNGAHSLLVRTVDTDVVVILMGKYHNLVANNPEAEIWVAFGLGANFFFISINTVSSNLGEDRSRAFHDQFFMHLLVLTPRPHSSERERRQPGKKVTSPLP